MSLTTRLCSSVADFLILFTKTVARIALIVNVVMSRHILAVGFLLPVMATLSWSFHNTISLSDWPSMFNFLGPRIYFQCWDTISESRGGSYFENQFHGVAIQTLFLFP